MDITIFLSVLSSILSGTVLYFIKKWLDDNKAYREKREAEEKRLSEQKKEEYTSMKTAMRYLIETQFLYEKNRVKEIQMFPTDEQIGYKGLLVAAEALGFDGRIHSYWNFCIDYPDENGKIYHKKD